MMLRQQARVAKARPVDGEPAPLEGRRPLLSWRAFETALPSALLLSLSALAVVAWQLERGHAGSSPQWVWWIGLGIAALVSGSVWLALRSRRQEHEQARQHLAALESLNEISTAISAKLDSGTQALDQLAEAARRLVGAELAGILLL